MGPVCPAGQVHQQQQAKLQQEPGQLTVQLPHETQEHTKAKEARRPAPVPSWHDEQESLSLVYSWPPYRPNKAHSDCARSQT